MMVIKNRPSKMKFFCCEGIFFENFDFKNGCKNGFVDNNEQYCSRFKNRVPLKIDFRAELDSRVQPDSLGINRSLTHRVT